ncbi:hypothetical protein BC835DRAFT_1396972 [Cytidiella melzeri]|nr:hypothetical protein BC835DRAFT_1396972 [Cytidiella melzeri]
MILIRSREVLAWREGRCWWMEDKVRCEFTVRSSGKTCGFDNVHRETEHTVTKIDTQSVALRR